MDAVTEWQLEHDAKSAKEKERYEHSRERENINQARNNVLGLLPTFHSPNSLEVMQLDGVSVRENVEEILDRILCMRTAIASLEGSLNSTSEEEGRVITTLNVSEFFKRVAHHFFPDSHVIRSMYGQLSAIEIPRTDLPMLLSLSPEERAKILRTLDKIEPGYLGLLQNEVKLNLYRAADVPQVAESLVILQEPNISLLAQSDHKVYRFTELPFNGDMDDAEFLMDYAASRGRDVLAASNISHYLDQTEVLKSMVSGYTSLVLGMSKATDPDF